MRLNSAVPVVGLPGAPRRSWALQDAVPAGGAAWAWTGVQPVLPRTGLLLGWPVCLPSAPTQASLRAVPTTTSPTTITGRSHRMRGLRLRAARGGVLGAELGAELSRATERYAATALAGLSRGIGRHRTVRSSSSSGGSSGGSGARSR